MYSSDQMNQVAHVLEMSGYTSDDIVSMCSNTEALTRFKSVLSGISEIAIVKHIIDLDVDPMVPDGWSVEEHQKNVPFEWNPTKIALYLSDHQKGDKCTNGNKLRQELKDKSVFNACLLDYLLAHQKLIPDEWKVKAVFFWDTIYRDPNGDLCIRCLIWGGDEWNWSSARLNDDFNEYESSLISVSD